MMFTGRTATRTGHCLMSSESDKSVDYLRCRIPAQHPIGPPAIGRQAPLLCAGSAGPAIRLLGDVSDLPDAENHRMKTSPRRSSLTRKHVYAPCYWHQNHVLCSNLMRSWIRRGFRACFLVSASVDGDVPARIARSWGAEVIRGSANQTGALVLRDMQKMMKDGVAIVTTADGPNGPKYEFKVGAVLMAKIGGTPLVPIACAADRAWYLNRWDDFMIPKPFARIVYAVGEPVSVPRDAAIDKLDEYRLQMQYATNTLMEESKQLLNGSPK